MPPGGLLFLVSSERALLLYLKDATKTNFVIDPKRRLAEVKRVF
jgi:hypothetical protein